MSRRKAKIDHSICRNYHFNYKQLTKQLSLDIFCTRIFYLEAFLLRRNLRQHCNRAAMLQLPSVFATCARFSLISIDIHAKVHMNACIRVCEAQKFLVSVPAVDSALRPGSWVLVQFSRATCIYEIVHRGAPGVQQGCILPSRIECVYIDIPMYRNVRSGRNEGREESAREERRVIPREAVYA